MKATLLERFEAKYIPEPNSGCWLWLAATNPAGYGVIRDANSKQTSAQRISFELFKGPIPNGLVVDHLCRNTFCVNPDHLDAVPQKENVRRGKCAEVTGALNRERQFCKHGHPFEGDNLIVRPSGGRDCRACRRRRVSEYYFRHKEARAC